ncbi:hypothetical protein GCM10009551_064690 [Nocardiopsis tropica]|uniref:hypothetical protein n=1 Tax=Tsukamurella strandjordii TaxID=147577 RepID=UPI0031CEFF12
MARDIFDQRERWIEELREYVLNNAAVICQAGVMALPAITEEIEEAALDPQPHNGMQKNDWTSRARDLEDSLKWVGPELASLVTAAVRDLHRLIANDLLTGSSGPRAVDDSKRPDVAKWAAALGALLDQDDALVAAWRDLITACKNPDHRAFSGDRVKYLRDTVIALCHRRNQDPGASGQLQTALDVLLGSDHTVRIAQHSLGDEVDLSKIEINGDSALGPDELQALSERCVVAPTPTGNFVVWFRIDHAFVKGSYCATHGAVAFYPAVSLAGALTDYDSARELYGVVPEELLIEQVRELQTSDEGPNEHMGFEYKPGLVYARVEVSGVERHHAMSRARNLLDAILKVIGTDTNTWEVLKGSLLFGETERLHYHSLSWGLKHEHISHTLDHMNDHFTDSLRELGGKGVTITADAATELLPVLQLQEELREAPDSNPEAVVRAAVRAIEHCNARTERPSLKWTEYVTKYLVDFYTVEKFAHRAVADVFQAAVAHVPDHSPGAAPVQELRDITADIRDNSWDGPIVRARTVAHTGALRRIYRDHWLARSLAELDDTLASPGALAKAFADETERVDACTARLRRTRNAAIHGGPISTAACETIAEFARRIAAMALSNVIEAVIDGACVEPHTQARRDRYRTRVEMLTQNGDLENLFGSPPTSPAAR